MYRCDSFPLLSAPHSLFSIWTNLKIFEKIPGTQACRWGEWIWLTGSSALHRSSLQGLNISSISISERSQIQKSQSPFAHCQDKTITIFFSSSSSLPPSTSSSCPPLPPPPPTLPPPPSHHSSPQWLLIIYNSYRSSSFDHFLWISMIPWYSKNLKK